ncbi:MAG: hypothetical protein ACP5NS_02545 [Candidatus Pacearchaeota archaeon]
MKKLSRKEAQSIVEEFFDNSQRIEPAKVKKMKSFAMTHRIRLGEYRKRFCKKCYVDLSLGRVRLNKKHKQVTCGVCGAINRWAIKKN